MSAVHVSVIALPPRSLARPSKCLDQNWGAIKDDGTGGSGRGNAYLLGSVEGGRHGDHGAAGGVNESSDDQG